MLLSFDCWYKLVRYRFEETRGEEQMWGEENKEMYY